LQGVGKRVHYFEERLNSQSGEPQHFLPIQCAGQGFTFFLCTCGFRNFDHTICYM
jgi:hypothetical protein